MVAHGEAGITRRLLTANSSDRQDVTYACPRKKVAWIARVRLDLPAEPMNVHWNG